MYGADTNATDGIAMAGSSAQSKQVFIQNWIEVSKLGATQNASQPTDISVTVENGVDFVLQMFPPDEISKSDQSNEINADLEEDMSALRYESSEFSASADELHEVSTHDTAPEKKEILRFDQELGSSYGFTELNVSFVWFFFKIIR